MTNDTKGMPSVIRYRVVVGGVGIIFAGESLAEALRQFTLFAVRSARKSVALFKDCDIIKEFQPPARELVGVLPTMGRHGMIRYATRGRRRRRSCGPLADLRAS